MYKVFLILRNIHLNIIMSILSYICKYSWYFYENYNVQQSVTKMQNAKMLTICSAVFPIPYSDNKKVLYSFIMKSQQYDAENAIVR